MKAKNAKVGTRVQVKPNVEYYSGELGTILGPSGPVFDVQVMLDANYKTSFDFNELRRVK